MNQTAIADVAELIADYHDRAPGLDDELLAARILGFLRKAQAEGLYDTAAPAAASIEA